MAPDPEGLGSRRLAWRAVTEALRRRTPLDDMLDELAPSEGLAPRDLALARAIAVVTFRRLGTIRHALEERLARDAKDPRLFSLLAIGAAQILVLDVPDRAAVDTAVDLARADRSLRHAGGLVNAVLRRIAREKDTILAADDPWIDTPAWLRERWTAHYGAETALAVAQAHRGPASVDITVREDPAGWAARLGGLLLPTGSVRLADRTAIQDLPGFAEGAWWVQDAAAALPARLLAPMPGERVADLCAAPGGKTAQLAAAGAEVLAVDRSERRLGRVVENAARLRLPVRTLAADATALDAEPFDAVLLDAPCTATGTIRRHPDVAWSKTEGDLAKLSALQVRLLDRAADLVRPGGRLVYCTCSLEPEEGETQAEAFLARRPDFLLRPVAPEEVGGLAELVRAPGVLRTLPCHMPRPEPGRGELDGFFAARFVRRS